MKPVTLTLLLISLLLSVGTPQINQDIDPGSQTLAHRFVQLTDPLPNRSLASNPTGSLRGGSPTDPTESIWGGFYDHPARSLWGGFPLNPITIDTTSTPPTSAQSPSCEPTETFCVIEHHFPFQRPISPVFNAIVDSSYLYGSTQFGDLEPHHGVEIPSPTGMPVLAVDDGIAIVAGNDAHSVYGPWENFYGNLVVLEHRLSGMDEPVYTLYGHLSTVRVIVGQTVKAGEAIGEVGSSGMAAGSHLHFEIRQGTNQYTNTRNPALWLIPLEDEYEQQNGILAGSLENAEGNPIHFTIKAEHYPHIDEPPEKIYFIETYATDMESIGSNDNYHENFALMDLPPGHYRLVLSASGKWTERWVDVEPGKLSFITIVSKQQMIGESE
jgi:murein DD-endopeptidase MepM/ murein hydrolase activator NlpD